VAAVVECKDLQLMSWHHKELFFVVVVEVVVHVQLYINKYHMNISKKKLYYLEQYVPEFYNYNYIENVLHDVHQQISTIDFLFVDDEYLKYL
jgi:hypothetical protein